MEGADRSRKVEHGWSCCEVYRALRPFFAARAFFFLSGISEARIQPVTLPAPESARLTIYSSADMKNIEQNRPVSLRESREGTFRKNVSRIEFSRTDTGMKPATSIESKAPEHQADIKVVDTVFPAALPNVPARHIKNSYDEIMYFTSRITWTDGYISWKKMV